MKHNKKKFFTALILAVMMTGLTACGSTAESTLSYNAEYLNSVADFLIANWAGLPEEDIASFADMDADEAEEVIDANGLPFEAEAFTGAFGAYEGVAEDLGAYVETVEYGTPEVSGDEITLNVTVQYEQRQAEVSIVFDEDSVVQSVDLSPHYTMSEILYKAVMNTVLGMGTVFLVLIFISLVIYCFKFIPAIQEKLGRKGAAAKDNGRQEKAGEAAVSVSEEPAPAEEAEELTDDAELVAAITAAVCAYEGTSADGFVVRSIRRAEKPSWNRA